MEFRGKLIENVDKLVGGAKNNLYATEIQKWTQKNPKLNENLEVMFIDKSAINHWRKHISKKWKNLHVCMF